MRNPDWRSSPEPMRPEERAFREAISRTPEDDATRLVYADWLEEQGFAAKARFVRLEVELSGMEATEPRMAPVCRELNALDAEIGDNWSGVLDRPDRVRNCGESVPRERELKFAFECPNRWTDLQATDDANIRFCGQCDEYVYACSSRAEAEQHAILGHCVAISRRVSHAVETEKVKRIFREERIVGRFPIPTRPTSQGHPAPPVEAEPKRWWQFWK